MAVPWSSSFEISMPSRGFKSIWKLPKYDFLSTALMKASLDILLANGSNIASINLSS